MKKMTTLGAVALLSVASVSAQAQVQTLNDSALSEINGQGMGLYSGLVQGNKHYTKAAVVDAAVFTAAIVGTPAAVIASTAVVPAAALVYAAGPVVAVTALASVPFVQAGIFVATPVVAAIDLVRERKVAKDGTGIRHAAAIMVAGGAAIIATPFVATGVAVGAIALNGPAAAAVLASGPVIGTGAIVAGTGVAILSAGSFVHHAGHVVGRTLHNGHQMAKAHRAAH